MYSGPSTSRSSRRQSTVNYRISVSSNEEPFSPPVSEYLPSSSPSPTIDLGNTLPCSILNDIDFSLRDCLGNDTLFSTPTSTTRNDLIFIASPTVVFISNPQKTISMGNKDSYENLALSAGNYIEGINPLPNDADLEPVSTWYNETLPKKSITAAEPETEPTFTSPTRTLLTLDNTTAMLPEAEPTSIECPGGIPLVEHNTAAEPGTELTSTSPARTPPVPSIAVAIVPHSHPPIIACHGETLPAGHFSTTEPEATSSRPVLATEANTNPRKRKRNPEKWSKTQKKKNIQVNSLKNRCESLASVSLNALKKYPAIGGWRYLGNFGLLVTMKLNGSSF